MNVVHDWENPLVTSRNRELSHVPWGAYADAESARTCNRTASPFVKTLNGQWKFLLAPGPLKTPAGFEQETFNDAAWGAITVPGNWQLQGHDRPVYTNLAYPFPPDPPRIPEENPTGCYRMSFDVPADWQGRDIFVLFESVDSAFYLYVNGVEVGYSQDSKLPAEFNITPHVRPGRNLLAAKVLRYCDGTYLEDQDYWQLSGIQRDVRLMAKPRTRLRDWTVRTTFDSHYRDAQLYIRAGAVLPEVKASLKDGCMIQYPGAEAYRVEAMLYDGERPVLPAPLSAPLAPTSPMYGGSTAEALSAELTATIAAPRPWTPETPDLYTLVLTLRDAQGKAVDFESSRVGFRQVEIKAGMVLLNGRRLVVRGVDRHEFHPRRGRAVTDEDMLADIRRMKQLNFNAVRTCHYPDHTRWYDLCDEVGLALVDETNLETHGVERLLSTDPLWASAYLERSVRMVLRDRNHPCVLFWSLGNESGCGPHHHAMAAWIRAFDPTRPVQYESGNPGPAVSDVMAPMYPNLNWVREALASPDEHRPMIMCEYAYAKGNSSGNFKDFWDLVDVLPRFQGGFIWDWSDKALVRTTADGREYFAYGEMEGEPPHMERMCLNGVVGPTLEPHPGAFEIQKVQAPVAIRVKDATALAAGDILLQNKHLVLDLSHLEIEWQVMEDGAMIQSGRLPPVRTAPGASETIRIPFTTPPALKPGAEYWLNIRLLLAGATPWAAKGHAVTWEQFRLPWAAPAALVLVPRDPGALDLQETDDEFVLNSSRVRAVFGKKAGTLTSLQGDGLERLTVGPRECFYRAPTDIDYAIGDGGFAHTWKVAGLDRLTRTIASIQAARLDSNTVQVRVTTDQAASGTGTRFRCETTWTIFASGDLVADCLVLAHADVPTIPRIGLALALPGAFDRFAWYGRGPWENYVDRKNAAGVGAYDRKVADLLGPYIFPQENGGLEDVRWCTVTDGSGAGLWVQGLPLLHVSAQRYRIEDFMAANNVVELVPRKETILHLDGRHMGVGGDTGWSQNLHPEHRILPGEHRFRLRLCPLRKGDDPATLARTEVPGFPRTV